MGEAGQLPPLRLREVDDHPMYHRSPGEILGDKIDLSAAIAETKRRERTSGSGRTNTVVSEQLND
jgi:hypothetical protein